MSKRDDFTFNGFEPANTTPVPDILFDELLSQLTGAELKVLLYIIRRTRGFKKDTDAISLSQFQKGIITKERKQLDKGCGVGDRQTIIDALASLEKKKCIVSEKTKTVKGDNATTLYRILFSQEVVGKAYHGSREKPTTVVGKAYHRGRENGTTVVGNSNPQETVLQQTDSQETVSQESVTPTIADMPACGASAPAPSALPLQEKTDKQEIPVTYADCLAYLQEHNALPQGDAVQQMTQARILYASQQKGQTDGHSQLRSTHHGADYPDSGSVSHPGEAEGQRIEQTPSSTPVQVLPPLATLSKMPEQAAFMAPAEPKPRAKAAPKKPVEKPAGPPVAPPVDMEWSTRKCLQWFDFWRGAPLIGKFKLMQASTCAKGLAENYSEAQVLSARTDMEADVYWMARGGCDVCDVANNIHKYVRKRQLTIAEKAKDAAPVKITREMLHQRKP